MRERKLIRVQLKADEPGSFRATLATFNVVDHQGDVTFTGAFPDGKEIVISAYGHASWDGALPVGKGVIGSDKKTAWVDGQFFDTPAGQEHYETVKALGDLCEWSYGFDALETSFDEDELAKYPGAFRGLRKVDVHEASPVLLGAGIGTGTQSIKSFIGPFVDHAEYALAGVQAFTSRANALAALRRDDGRKEGRELSKANREKLASVAAAMDDGAAALRKLLSDTDPDKARQESEALRSAHLRLETRSRRPIREEAIA